MGNIGLYSSKNKDYKTNIINFIKQKNDKIKVIDIQHIRKNGKLRIVVKMKCECGAEFSKTWEHIYLDNKYLCCKKCAKQYRDGAMTKKRQQKYLFDFESSNYEIIDKTQVLRANSHVEVIEKTTGYRGFVEVCRVKKTKKILVFSLNTNKKNLIYNLNIYAQNNGINSKVLKLVDNDNWKTQAIECKCECGNVFYTTYRAFLKGKWLCDDCTKRYSKNEILIENLLEQEKIKYIRQYKFHDCSYIRELFFDFYLPDYNICIEVDGEQHYKPVNFGSSLTQEQCIERFEKYKQRDFAKDDFCKNHNIPLIRIKYTDIYNENYKDIILNFINSFKN